MVEELKKMNNCDTDYFNNAEVHLYNRIYFIWEIPRYGGLPQYVGHCTTAKKAYELIESLT